MSLEIHSNNEKVNKIISGIIDICILEGAWFSPNLKIIEDRNEIKLVSKEKLKEKIIEIPKSLLIPTNSIDWIYDENENKLKYLNHKNLTSNQIKLLDLHINLYNELNKYKTWIKNSILNKTVNNNDLKREIIKIKPYFKKMVDKQIKEKDFAKNFISSRLFNFKKSKENYLVPIFDFFNHNSNSLPYKFENHKLTVKQFKSKLNDESFITYGNSRDVIDIALKYNFVDHSSSLVFSAPIEFFSKEIGSIKILGLNRKITNNFAPPLFEYKENKLILCDLYFNYKNPKRIHNLVYLIVSSINRNKNYESSKNYEISKKLIIEIKSRNILILQYFIQELTRFNLFNNEMILEACKHQLNNLQNFKI